MGAGRAGVVSWCWARLAYQIIASVRDARPVSAAGNAGGTWAATGLHIHSTGEGGPGRDSRCGLDRLLIELVSGARPEVARFTRRSAAYDRAGHGLERWPARRRGAAAKSCASCMPCCRTQAYPDRMFWSAIRLAACNVRLFAHEYPQETAGLVLVDSAVEDQLAASSGVGQTGRMPRMLQQLEDGRPWSKFGIIRFFLHAPQSEAAPPLCSRPTWRLRFRGHPTWKRSAVSGSLSRNESAEQVRAARPLPPVAAGGAPPPASTATNRRPGISTEDFAQWNALPARDAGNPRKTLPQQRANDCDQQHARDANSTNRGGDRGHQGGGGWRRGKKRLLRPFAADIGKADSPAVRRRPPHLARRPALQPVDVLLHGRFLPLDRLHQLKLRPAAVEICGPDGESGNNCRQTGSRSKPDADFEGGSAFPENAMCAFSVFGQKLARPSKIVTPRPAA